MYWHDKYRLPLFDFVLYQGTKTDLPKDVLKKHGFGVTIVLHRKKFLVPV